MLNTTARYFLKKEDRLKSRKAIDMIFTKGKQFSNFPFKVLWMPENKAAALQTGLGVSSRNFKRAVDRNRIKRLMREAYRLQKNDLQQHLADEQKCLSVFILYTGKVMPDYHLVFEKFTAIISRLIKCTNEKSEVDT